jgi:heme/copper-type cytochrome/quinol oxidase subunit 2
MLTKIVQFIFSGGSNVTVTLTQRDDNSVTVFEHYQNEVFTCEKGCGQDGMGSPFDVIVTSESDITNYCVDMTDHQMYDFYLWPTIVLACVLLLVFVILGYIAVKFNKLKKQVTEDNYVRA